MTIIGWHNLPFLVSLSILVVILLAKLVELIFDVELFDNQISCFGLTSMSLLSWLSCYLLIFGLFGIIVQTLVYSWIALYLPVWMAFMLDSVVSMLVMMVIGLLVYMI